MMSSPKTGLRARRMHVVRILKLAVWSVRWLSGLGRPLCKHDDLKMEGETSSPQLCPDISLHTVACATPAPKQK